MIRLMRLGNCGIAKLNALSREYNRGRRRTREHYHGGAPGFDAEPDSNRFRFRFRWQDHYEVRLLEVCFESSPSAAQPFQIEYFGGQVPWPPGYFACITRSIPNSNGHSSLVLFIPRATRSVRTLSAIAGSSINFARPITRNSSSTSGAGKVWSA